MKKGLSEGGTRKHKISLYFHFTFTKWSWAPFSWWQFSQTTVWQCQIPLTGLVVCLGMCDHPVCQRVEASMSPNETADRPTSPTSLPPQTVPQDTGAVSAASACPLHFPDFNAHKNHPGSWGSVDSDSRGPVWGWVPAFLNRHSGDANVTSPWWTTLQVAKI